MPKPLYGIPGNGMHYNVSLFKDGDNVFYDENDEFGLSSCMRYFMAGVLNHPTGLAAVSNPRVNSYKRMQSGFEAPKYVDRGGSDRSPLSRSPASRGKWTRAEARA